MGDYLNIHPLPRAALESGIVVKSESDCAESEVGCA